VQVVLDDGGVLLETSIHPEQKNAAMIAMMGKNFMIWMRIVVIF
jgi:hypothetical protein